MTKQDRHIELRSYQGYLSFSKLNSVESVHGIHKICRILCPVTFIFEIAKYSILQNQNKIVEYCFQPFSFPKLQKIVFYTFHGFCRIQFRKTRLLLTVTFSRWAPVPLFITGECKIFKMTLSLVSEITFSFSLICVSSCYVHEVRISYRCRITLNSYF